jgi:hypothetical protein
MFVNPVSSPYLEWNTIENMIIKWNRVFREFDLVTEI